MLKKLGILSLLALNTVFCVENEEDLRDVNFSYSKAKLNDTDDARKRLSSQQGVRQSVSSSSKKPQGLLYGILDSHLLGSLHDDIWSSRIKELDEKKEDSSISTFNSTQVDEEELSKYYYDLDDQELLRQAEEYLEKGEYNGKW